MPPVKIVCFANATTGDSYSAFLMTAATRASAKLQSDELKDAYRVWLKDLYDDKPEKLLRKLGSKKNTGGGRARRAQRLRHAQQHTAASALKDVALKKVTEMLLFRRLCS